MRFEADACLLQLALQILMPIEAEFDAPWRIATPLDEQRSGISIVDVEIMPDGS